MDVACKRTDADPTVTRQYYAILQQLGQGKSPGKMDLLQDDFVLLGLASAHVRKPYLVCIFV